MTWQSQCLMLLLNGILASVTMLSAKEPCGPVSFSKCDGAVGKGVDYQGFTCGDRCLNKEAWCALDGYFIKEKSLRCDNWENYNADNCFKARFSIVNDMHQFDYMFLMVKTDWQIAEMICQAHGYNLFSISTQNEFDEVIKRLNAVAENPEKWKEYDQNFSDPLGQRCWPEGKKIHIWLGLFHNRWAEGGILWEYTDGTRVDWTVHAPGVEKLGGQFDHLLTAISSVLTTKNPKGVLRGKYEDGQFKPIWQDYYIHVDNGEYRSLPYILCKRQKDKKPKKWSPELDYFNPTSTTGYMCPNSTVPLIGPTYFYGKILDGFADCVGSIDEAEPRAPTYNASNGHGKLFMFLPIPTTPEVLIQYCDRIGWTLPSVHTENDKEILQSLFGGFGKSRPQHDFWSQSRDWTDFKHHSRYIHNDILLAREVQKGDYWNDGTKITVDILPREKPSSTNDAGYAYLLTNSSIAIQGSKKIYVICQTDAQTRVRFDTLNYILSILAAFIVINL